MPPEKSDERVQPADTMASLFRGFCLIGVFAMFVIGAYYGLLVFRQVGGLIASPESAKDAVTAIAEIIEADQLTVIVAAGSEPIKPGRTIAFGLLLFCYMIWLWVPMAIISTTSRVLLRGYDRRKSGE